MKRIKHILFPIDFSERCCAAVPFVEAMASHYESKVTLISAGQPFLSVGLADPCGPVMVDSETTLADLQERLDHALTREFAHLRVQRIAKMGDPAEVITGFAHRNVVDLIMMPTHGYGHFRRLLLGSVTARVLHDAHCPVWTAAHMEGAPFEGHRGCRTILCAIDGTPHSAPLMQWAAAFAADLGANLKLVHVAGPAEDDESQPIEDLQHDAKIDVPLHIVSGPIAEGVQKEAELQNADLLVIGRGKLQEGLGRLRAHSDAIIRQSPCPVLSV